MPSISIDISHELFEQMNQFPNIDWNLIISRMFEEYFKELSRLDELATDSQLGMKDVAEISKLIEASAWKKFKQRHVIR